MDLSEKIIATLQADSALTALVQDRIFPVIGDRELAAPALLYTIVGGFDLGETHDDASVAAPVLSATLVQFTAYATTRDNALLVIRRVRAAFLAAQEPGTFAVHISGTPRESRENLGPGLRLFRADVDLTIDHQLAV
jgi:hypothetical protein